MVRQAVRAYVRACVRACVRVDARANVAINHPPMHTHPRTHAPTQAPALHCTVHYPITMATKMVTAALELVDDGTAGSQRVAVLENHYDIQMRHALVPTPLDNEVRVKITYVGICGSDLETYARSKQTNKQTPWQPSIRSRTL